MKIPTPKGAGPQGHVFNAFWEDYLCKPRRGGRGGTRDGDAPPPFGAHCHLMAGKAVFVYGRGGGDGVLGACVWIAPAWPGCFRVPPAAKVKFPREGSEKGKKRRAGPLLLFP